MPAERETVVKQQRSAVSRENPSAVQPFIIENETHNRLIGKEPVSNVATPSTDRVTENGHTLRRERVSRSSPENDMGSRKPRDRDRQLVDAGLAGESHQASGTEDLRGRVSASTLADAGHTRENSGYGLFFASGGGHNVRFLPGAAKLVKGAHYTYARYG
jgi:hypothetical protein